MADVAPLGVVDGLGFPPRRSVGRGLVVALEGVLRGGSMPFGLVLPFGPVEQLPDHGHFPGDGVCLP